MSSNTMLEKHRSMRPAYGLAALRQGEHLVPCTFRFPVGKRRARIATQTMIPNPLRRVLQHQQRF